MRFASDFESNAEDISVEPTGTVESYRSAHSVALLSARGEASTKELRAAMLHRRSPFDELLKAGAATAETRTVPNSGLSRHSVR